MKSSMSFNFISPLVIEETSKGKAIISGILATTGVSRNNNFYDMESLNEIAKTIIGKAVYYGTRIGFNKNTGLLVKNLHDDREESRIGKVIKTIVERKNRIVRFFAEIFNTKKYPNILSKIKAGFGVSIKGISYNAKLMVEKGKKAIVSIRDIIVESLQIFKPSVKAGVEKAKVESIEIQEMYLFSGSEPLTMSNLVEMVQVVEAVEKAGLGDKQ